jgi:hypothetical protein
LVWEPVHAQSPCAEESPVDRTPVVPAVVNGAKQSQQVWDTDHERTRLNVGTIITSPKGPVYSLVQIEEGRQLLIKAGSRPLNSEEGNYAVVQLELLAVSFPGRHKNINKPNVAFCSNFRRFLDGDGGWHSKVTMFTTHVAGGKQTSVETNFLR